MAVHLSQAKIGCCHQTVGFIEYLSLAMGSVDTIFRYVTCRSVIRQILNTS
jgi:hypothetical protein